MDNLLTITTIGLAAGVIGTGLGGVIALYFAFTSNKFLSILLGFTGGLMLSVVCFDLLPEAFNLAPVRYSVTGVTLGVVVIIVLDETASRVRNKKKDIKKTMINIGILMGISIAIHNLPEGLAIGSAFTAGRQFGLALTLVMILHDIPEGIVMCLPMRIGGISGFKVIMSAVAAGIPTGVGAFIGALLGSISSTFISACLGFAAGAMLYIICSELIPESYNIYRGRASGVGLIIGVIAGILICQGV